MSDNELVQYRTEFESVVEHFSKHKIEDDTQQRIAAEGLKDVKFKLNVVETKQEEMLAPQRQAMNKTREFFAPYLEAARKAESILKTAIAQYHDKKRLEEAKVLEAAAKSDSSSARAIIDTAALAAPSVSGVSFREAYDVVIVDPKLVPREYLIVDEKKIKAVVKASRGTIMIPGVRVTQTTQVAASKRG